jgi:hypothetical protein
LAHKDPTVRREYMRRYMQMWRHTHRPLSTAEIEDRLRMLGLAIYTAEHPMVISLDDPAGAREVDRQAYADWAAMPFDDDSLEDPEDVCGIG